MFSFFLDSSLRLLSGPGPVHFLTPGLGLVYLPSRLCPVHFPPGLVPSTSPQDLAPSSSKRIRLLPLVPIPLPCFLSEGKQALYPLKEGSLEPLGFSGHSDRGGCSGAAKIPISRLNHDSPCYSHTHTLLVILMGGRLQPLGCSFCGCNVASSLFCSTSLIGVVRAFLDCELAGCFGGKTNSK